MKQNEVKNGNPSKNLVCTEYYLFFPLWDGLVYIILSIVAGLSIYALDNPVHFFHDLCDITRFNPSVLTLTGVCPAARNLSFYDHTQNVDHSVNPVILFLVCCIY